MKRIALPVILLFTSCSHSQISLVSIEAAVQAEKYAAEISGEFSLFVNAKMGEIVEIYQRDKERGEELYRTFKTLRDGIVENLYALQAISVEVSITTALVEQGAEKPERLKELILKLEAARSKLRALLVQIGMRSVS